VFFTAAAFWLRWDLALAVCVIAPAFWLMSQRLAVRMTPATQQERAGNAALIATVEHALSILTLARIYNRQADEAAAVHRAGTRWLRAGLRQARVSQVYQPVWEIIEAVSVLAILGMGGWEIAAGRLTLGGLLSFAGFLGFLYPSLQSLGGLAMDAASAAAAAERLFFLRQASSRLALRTPRAVVASLPCDPSQLARRPCGVLLERVSFRYPGARRPSLNGVSLSVLPGELVAITGPSGTGKSTLASLLVGLLEPSAGRISIGGIPARRLAPDVLRQLVTLLPQQVTLLPRSIAANIAYGRPGATPEQIITAARAAGAHEFISRLPAGYRTVIGPDGHGLSGGQARRLTLARALLRESPVLVLDEPTAALDPAAARQIAMSVRRAVSSQACATILITHDPAVAAVADRVLVLQDGLITPRSPQQAVAASASTRTF
jgi:ATP-binding cassette subfamily B protein